MVIDNTTIRVEIQKNGARKLSMQGRPFGLSVLLSRTRLQQLLEELSVALVPTPYEVLDVPPTASDAEIQAAYRARAKQAHPDLHDGETHKAMQDVNESYAILSDPGKRKLYDATMKGA